MRTYPSGNTTRGFTVMELMMVLTMVGILAAIAAPSFTNMIARNRIKATSSNLQISFYKARSEAIKRNANVTVSPITGSNWESGWRVRDAANNVLYTIDAPETDIVASSGTAITYQSTGRILNIGTARTFSIADNNISLDDPSKRCVSIGLSGIPGISKGPC